MLGDVTGAAVVGGVVTIETADEGRIRGDDVGARVKVFSSVFCGVTDIMLPSFVGEEGT